VPCLFQTWIANAARAFKILSSHKQSSFLWRNIIQLKLKVIRY